ncbi:MAG: MerR family transcriptional regulator [Acidimicrobiales bacterium]
MVDGEGYLSIGEVLAQVQEEFPELSISKIRFLESKGLIDPERTPSGYRKFFPRDIIRLRRILQIQRETYMPLKMIKDILDEEEATQGGSRDDGSPTLTLIEGDRFEAVHQEDLDEGLADAAAMRAVSSQAEAAPELAGPNEPSRSPSAPRHSGDGAIAEVLAQLRSSVSAQPREDVEPPHVGVHPASYPGPGETSLRRSETVSHTVEPDASQTMFSIEELSRLTGARVSEIQEMETYGLIESKNYAGERYYAQIDFEIVQILTVFQRFGIGSRHLRMYKISAEREVGFMEQVIAPLLRQRNPSARKRASEQLSDLRTLGTCLRGYYIEKLLEKYLDL